MITQDQASQGAMTPAAALQLLKDGNRRFLDEARTPRRLTEQVAATRSGQYPFALVLGCIDSRVAVEHVFDLGLGDAFAARVAGTVVDEDVLGGMEFACKVAGTKLIVVLGHTACGAVKGACDDVQLGNLTALLSKLKPAVAAVTEPSDPAQRTSANTAFVDAVARRNVELSVEAIRERSPVLAELEAQGDIAVVGAMYDVATGAVEFLD